MFDYWSYPVHPADLPRPRVRSVDVLYLDFDGVLHPEDVWLLARGGKPFVKSPPGRHVFERAQLLAELLEPYPHVGIVLSTSWVRKYRYRRTTEFLPPSLAGRCIGSTFHSRMDRRVFEQLPRGRQVRADVGRRTPANWLALDDMNDGWNGAEENVVITHEIDGIGDPDTCRQIREALRRFQR